MAKESYPDFSNESNVWGYFFGESVPRKERAKRQSLMLKHARELKRFFGTRELWIRYLLAIQKEWDSSVKSGKASPTLHMLDTKGYVTKKDGMHPRALRLLIEHGQVYSPGITDNVYASEPRSGQCFANSCALMLNQNRKYPRAPIVYVEGLVVGAASFIMPHGWNAYSISARNTIDWTHYAATRWSYYLGIPFTEAEVRELAAVAGHPGRMGAIFTREWFSPQVEQRVREILAARQK